MSARNLNGRQFHALQLTVAASERVEHRDRTRRLVALARNWRLSEHYRGLPQ